MRVLHITPNSDGYEIVTLVANKYNRKNHLSVIEKDGEQFFTGGLLIHDTPMTRTALDEIPKDFQYVFVQSFRQEPFIKEYYEK